MKMFFMKALSITVFVSVLVCFFACTTSKSATKKGAIPAERVLLCVSFGTSYNDNRDLSIGAVEKSLQAAFPDYEVRRAFTSQIIIDKLKKRDKIVIDNVEQAMARLVADGVKEVLIQPTHVMSGFEYDDIVKEVSPYKDKFTSFKFSSELLASDKDFKRLAEVLVNETKAYNNKDTAIVWMGHGTAHKANAVYEKMQKTFFDAGYKNYFVGTVEYSPTIEDVLARVKKTSAKKVVLYPMMIVAGDHANNDMAGNEEDSWKTIFQKAGYNVETVLKGMGECEGVRQMIIDHAKEATELNTVNSEKKKPLKVSQIKDGKYQLTNVEADSSMFRVVACSLTVSKGKMFATITMSGKGYGKMYMGTGEAALKAKATDYILAKEDAEGKKSFTLPIDTLNDIIVCSAWSIKKEQWYDRNLIFWSDGIPSDALSEK